MIFVFKIVTSDVSAPVREAWKSMNIHALSSDNAVRFAERLYPQSLVPVDAWSLMG